MIVTSFEQCWVCKFHAPWLPQIWSFCSPKRRKERQTRKLRKLLAKEEEEEEVQKDV